ncbi:MAG: RNA 2',3'-cyclic phosphodiesterase [Nanoarchaeota archaeon]|jgi:2'-5' RNA ligase|nr:RNA 2',3'-cyclic phosphodiesterase [Nanoarchaeota archaeon]|tara:strand:- start:12222 stop:12737 length:516 start_codon:yes stop_codon:yes gene_type:complete
MRIFIAIDLPETIKEKLKKIKVDERIAEVNSPGDYHLTLRFLGEIDNKRLELVKNNLRKIKFKSFKLKLNKVGFFPNFDYINIVWVGVTPKRKIIELKQRIDDTIMDLFSREKRFDPHITLGRVKNMRDKDKFREVFDLEFGEEFKVDKFKLIKSELTKEGVKYEALEEYA